jgi:hypothetical protein
VICHKQQIVRAFVSCAVAAEDPAVQVDAAVAVYTTPAATGGGKGGPSAPVALQTPSTGSEATGMPRQALSP